VSLDAFAVQNDAFRGKGNFDAAMRALELYRAAGFDPKVLLTVTRQTLPGLERFLIFLIERGFTSLNVHWFRPIGRGRGHDEWSVNAVEIGQSIRRAFARFGVGEVRFCDQDGGEQQQNCGVGRFLNIMPNGDVFPCHVLTDPEFRCGNVRTQKLMDICRQNGLLGQLAGLDFSTIARQEPGVSDLTKAGACLGAVYAEKPELRVWRDHLSLPAVQELTGVLIPPPVATKSGAA
jgi:MoaA/NifB/PqqE/SkfB family radical SAM enzyme